MTQIDWSKAPADATHYHPRAGGYQDHWIKPGHFCVVGFEAKGWVSDLGRSAMKLAVLRPAAAPAWNGEGLPPVGTTCELRSRGGGWGEAEIRYHGRGLCVWLWVRHDGNTDQIEYADSPDRLEFRPIRTAEQVAAEERKKGVEEMLNHSPVGRSMFAKDFCEALYDAGARMPGEGSKA